MHVIVTLLEPDADRDRVKRELMQHGFRPAVGQSFLESMGLLAGEAEPSRLAELKTIAGVAEIEPDQLRRAAPSNGTPVRPKEQIG